MPLYEYECLACRKHTEKIQKFSDPEITTCPHCGGELKRVISAPAIAFKGGGWYADGYASARRADPGKSADTPAADAGSSAAAPATSSESTSAASAPAAAAPATSASAAKD